MRDRAGAADDDLATAGSGVGGPPAAVAPSRTFDVFLSYTSCDREVVERVARRLVEEGLTPFFDLWALTPGAPWQEELAHALRASSACAVFVGPEGLGDWAREELAVAQDRAARDRRFRLFMVLLEGAPRVDDPSLAFLSTRTWVDLRGGVADAVGFEELVAAIVGRPPRRGPTAPAAGAPCPYRGLAPFEEDHADLFFGREDDIRRLVERLREARFLTVLGPSGSGKSSLVRAGLIPALHRGALPDSDRWTIRRMSPGGRPLDALAAEVVRLFARDGMQQTVDDLEHDERTLDLAVTLGLGVEPAGRRLLLVVDQFEEVFTLCSDESQRAAFLSNLVYAATIPGGRTGVVLAMRADFYHRCAAYPQLRTLVAAQQFLVGPIDAEGLRRAVEEPAWATGLQIEPGLVETLLGAVAGRSGALPLLQHVLFELWERRRNRVLTLEAYAESGGVAGALAQRADHVYQSLTTAQQATARRVLLRLIQPGEGTEDTRRRVDMTELGTAADAPEDVDAVVGAHVDSRLLTSGHDPASGARVVEITHEALLDGWPLLRSWIDRDRERLLAERRLGEAAREWDASGRDPELLYRSARLAAWADRDIEELSPLEREYLANARVRAARERSSRRRRVRAAFASLVVVLAAISAAAIVATREGRRATRERDVARSRQLATAAGVELAADPRKSLQLALRAYDASPTAEAQTVLRQATFDYRAVAGARAHRGWGYTVAVSPDRRYIASGGTDGVRLWEWRRHVAPGRLLLGRPAYAVAFSRDGRRLVAAGKDGVIRVWTIPGRRARELGRARVPVFGIASGTDGRFATMDQHGRVLLWSLREPGRAKSIGRVPTPAAAVAFSPDGRLLAAGGADGRIVVWRAGSDRPPLVLAAGRGAVHAVTFSPGGRMLAAAAGDARVRVWTIGRDRPDLVLRGDPEGVFGVAFVGGGRVAAGGPTGAIRVWDPQGHLVGHFVGPTGRTSAIADGPGAGQLVSTGEDGGVWVWRPPATRVLDAGGKPINSVAVSKNGRRIAAVGVDGRIRVWTLTRKAPHTVVVGTAPNDLLSVAFDSTGRRLVAVGDTVVRVVAADGGALTVLGRLKAALNSAVFAPDDRSVVTAGEDGAVRAIDVGPRRRSTVVLGHDAPALDVAVTPGRSVVSVGEDRTVRVARLDAPHHARAIARYGHSLETVSVSPDGSELVTAATDGTIWIGTVERPFMKSLRGHDGPVWSTAFMPGGQIVSGGNDGTVRVWDPTTGAALVLRGRGGAVGAVAALPDGRTLLAGEEDGLVRIWSCDVCGSMKDVVRLARQRWLR